MMEQKKNNKILNIIIEVILIIIIIILLLHNCCLQKKASEYKNKKVPTGNVDVIEIKCDDSGKCVKDTSKKDNNDANNNTLPVINPTDDTEEEEEKEPESGLVVVDNYTVKWDGSKNLKIFTNPVYEFREIIAPESSNSYKFVVKNKTAYNLKYNMNFIETNPYNINLKYKLKKNGEYLIDEYVSASELTTLNQELDIKENDTYYLEWKWISSSNDTENGKAQADYKLKIDIKAESINE